MTMMSVAYREVLRRQLEWLPDLLPAKTRSFTFQVIDLDTLSLRPNGEWMRSDPFRKKGSIFFLDEKGNKLGEVGVKEKAYTTLAWSWKRFRFISMAATRRIGFCETVERALSGMTYPDKIKTRYILELSSAYYGGDAVLHKLPKSADDIVTWLGHKSKEARERFSSFLQTA